MERFLSQCAKFIYEKYSDKLQEVCLVFPNRRAGVFFTSYLQKEIKSPVIGPKITTINEFISGNSDLYLADKLQLISILYDVFKKHTKTKESFDEFYFWGEILLADFNDIDRYLVNTKDLFTNISDLKEIDSVFDYLTAEQKKALEHFWGSLVLTGKKEFQQKYISIWNQLYPVYADFKKSIANKKLAYGGMLDRLVVENLEAEDIKFDFEKYIIIGLNTLNNCEKKLFTHLQKQQKVMFLWDYDYSYLHDLKNEAGRFMRENLKLFPEPEDFRLNLSLFAQKKNIKMVAVSSVYGQAQQIPFFLAENRLDYKAEFDNTAIVLADESLLFSALGAIPESFESVNVTMGYPVKNSVIYGFLMLVINLLKNKRKEGDSDLVFYRFVTDVLNHQLLGNIETEKVKSFISELKDKNRITVNLNDIDFSDLHKVVFALPEKVQDFSSYFLRILRNFYNLLHTGENNKMLLELIFTIYQSLEKLGTVVDQVLEKQKQEISETVYFRLFNQYLSQVSVAFEGEPLSGLQLMGILETRCLDFKNLIILGLNENKWPRTFTAPSFLPYNIRKGFGLPGIDEQDAMYAYYFYRLIQRAKNVTATYSVVKEGIGTGELSRYGFQLKYDSIHKPDMINLDYLFANDPVKPIYISGTQQIANELLSRNSFEHPLSPSAINTYIQCSLRFYFRYLVGLPEPDEVKEEIDGVVFGNIFHNVIEKLYRPFVGKNITAHEIENLQKDKLLIANEITKQIGIQYFKQKDGSNKKIKIEGKTLLFYENIKTYLNQLLKVDKNIAPFFIESLENKYQSTLLINIDGNEKTVHVGGNIDRVDRLNGKYRVLDYKTGNVKSFSFKTIEELFARDAKEPKKEVLQAVIYSWALAKTKGTTQIQPVIYSLRELFAEKFKSVISWEKHDFSYLELEDELIANLKNLIAEIYSENNTFKQTEHLKKCEYCPYRKICQRY